MTLVSVCVGVTRDLYFKWIFEFLHVCLYTACELLGLRGQKMVSESLHLELQYLRTA